MIPPSTALVAARRKRELLALPDLVALAILDMIRRAESGELDGRDAAEVLYAAHLIPAPTAVAMAAYLQGPGGDNAATVLHTAGLIATPTAAAMANYLRGAAGPAPSLTVRNVASVAFGQPVTFVLAANPAGGYFVDVTLPEGKAGTGSGDMSKADNLAGLADKDAALANLGGGTGDGGGRALFKAADKVAARAALGAQAYDDDLQALAQFATAGVVIVRTANGFKQASLQGLTIGGTADAPVLNATPGLSAADLAFLTGAY